MDPFASKPRDLSSVEHAVRQAFEHARTNGEHEIAAELAAILEAMAYRAANAARLGGWDTVPASGRIN